MFNSKKTFARMHLTFFFSTFYRLLWDITYSEGQVHNRSCTRIRIECFILTSWAEISQVQIQPFLKKKGGGVITNEKIGGFQFYVPIQMHWSSPKKGVSTLGTLPWIYHWIYCILVEPYSYTFMLRKIGECTFWQPWMFCSSKFFPNSWSNGC